MKIPPNYIDKFRVILPDTLFPPPFKEALSVKRCPLCGCKLKTNLKKTLMICNSKKHRKPFVITPMAYYRIVKPHNQVSKKII